jgi:iron complex outermembrane receptor protein
MKTRTLFLLTTALCAAPALAQEAQTGQSSSDVAGTDGGLEEIVVTAQRRAENVQDVPIAVTAITGDTLQRNDVRDLARVEVLTPGFSFGRSGSDARPAIRGVRTENVGTNGDPTIGFFVDNVYRSRASMANEPFVDIERVEVQRGPQGTLYGRNTFGGNVAVASAGPSDELAAGVNLLYGNYDRRRADGYINLPASDAFQFRFAALREKMDGYVDGVTDALDIFDRDTSYLRSSVRIAPVDGFEMVLRHSYWREKGTGGAAFGYRVGGVFIDPARVGSAVNPNGYSLSGQPVRINIDPRVAGVPSDGIPDVAGRDIGFPVSSDPHFYPGDTRLEQDLKQNAFSANISFDVGPFVFRSITGYIDYEVFRTADNDFSLRAGNVDAQEDELSTISQELQIASPGDGPFEWIAGYFYYREDIDKSFFSSCPSADRARAGCAFTTGLPQTESNAVFGQASYWIIPDRLRLTGGIRYTRDKKDFPFATARTDANQRVTTVTYTGGRLSDTFEKTTWRANGEYHLTEDNMVYATVSTGFRSGGFNGGALTNPAVPATFGPETVTAYEVGSKNRFLDNSVQLNISVYRNEYRDLQVQNQFLVPAAGGGTSTTSVILNAGEAHSQGVEVELQAVPVERLNVALSGTLMKAEYDRYDNTAVPGTYNVVPAGSPALTTSYTGNEVPYSPTWKVTALVSYDFDLGGAGTITPQATLLASDGYFNTDTNTVLDRQGSYAKLDLRLGWVDASERFSLEAFVNNVTDEITLNRATFGSRGLNQSYDAPRMYGVRAGAKF